METKGWGVFDMKAVLLLNILPWNEHNVKHFYIAQYCDRRSSFSLEVYRPFVSAIFFPLVAPTFCFKNQIITYKNQNVFVTWNTCNLHLKPLTYFLWYIFAVQHVSGNKLKSFTKALYKYIWLFQITTSFIKYC